MTAILLTVGWAYASALSALVPKRGQLKVMRAALGDDATPEQIRDAANYLSRILAGRVNSPGVEQLRLIAKGLGYPTLSAFFAHLETGHASSTAIEHQKEQVSSARAVSKEAAALQAIALSQAVIAQTLKELKEIAKRAPVAKKSRRQTARPGTEKPKPDRVRGTAS